MCEFYVWGVQFYTQGFSHNVAFCFVVQPRSPPPLLSPSPLQTVGACGRTGSFFLWRAASSRSRCPQLFAGEKKTQIIQQKQKQKHFFFAHRDRCRVVINGFPSKIVKMSWQYNEGGRTPLNTTIFFFWSGDSRGNNKRVLHRWGVGNTT